MSQLNIKDLWIQQTKVNDENIFEPVETKIMNVTIELNEEENKIYERIIEKIEEIGKEWQEIETEMPQEWDMRDEIPEETNTGIGEITLEDFLEEINENIKGHGNSFIREIYEEIMKERREERNNENNEEIQENFNEDDQMEMNDGGNSSEELSELEDEPPRINRKRRHEDESQGMRKKNRMERKSKIMEELIQELETPVLGEEELTENEIEEDMEQNDIRKLIKMFHGIEKINRKQIKKWFEYGRRFEQQVEETKSKSKKRITDQTARGKVYEEMRKQITGNITKEAIRKRTQGCIKIYEIFMEIGRDKINRIKDCSVRTLIKLNREEIKQIKDHFRRK